MRALKYVLALVLAIGAAHLAWSSVIVAVLHTFFDHRVPNLRKIENSANQWEEITAAFVVESLVEARNNNKPTLMFLGSSVTYGYPWQEPVIFTRLVADKLQDRKVANLSIVGASMSSIDVATCALGQEYRPDVLIVEMPLVNSTSEIKVATHRHKPRKCTNVGRKATGYWPIVLQRPYGAGWISIVWDEEAYEKPEENLVISPLPPGYFANRKVFESMESRFVEGLRGFFNEVSPLGKRVYVYVSPVYTPGIDQAGGDRQAVEYQIELTNRICREFERVTCLDSSAFNSNRDLFYNLTHLNRRGHRALADWFIKQVAHQTTS